MNKGIVVTTHKNNEHWLKDCLASIKTRYPVLVVVNGADISTLVDTNNIGTANAVQCNDWNGFELGGILRGKEYFDEFVHLMDTTVVKDNSLFDKLFAIKGHVFLTNGCYHYMGKFVSSDLPEIPKIDNKADAIALERSWLKRPHSFFEPDLPVHTNIFEEKHGRKNMVLENDYIIKYKATWSL